jgi:hypothetical protein
MKKFFLTILSIICTAVIMWGQQQDDSFKHVILIEDADLKMFYEKSDEGEKKSYNLPTKGYRLQIYNGNDKQKASEVKMYFMKKYPGVRSYIIFHNPQYRVRVGDFINRTEAEAFQEKIKNDFSPSMILPDNINIQSKKTNP